MRGMPKSLGCGAMLAVMLIALILLMVGSNEAIGYYLSHCQEADMFDCMLGQVEDPKPDEGDAVATGTYSYKDYPVTITMNIPLAGGAVDGTVSGTCEGQVKGNYSGGSISGTLSGACSPFFVNIPASGDFNGTVNKGGKTVPITFTGRGGGFSHQGSMTLTYP